MAQLDIFGLTETDKEEFNLDMKSFLLGRMTKSGGGGGGVTVEPLSVTANGTYTAESGTAYSPVTVNVDLGEWHRPIDWPDLDALAEQIPANTDCVYLTYDLRKTPGYGWIGLYAEVTGGAWTVERGHVENGVFVSTYSQNLNSYAFFREALNGANGDVQLWRVTSNGQINVLNFCSSGTENVNLHLAMQPCVERAGRLPWDNLVSGSNGNSAYSKGVQNYWLERDALAPGEKSVVTSIQGRWNGDINLRSVDFSKWNTSLWQVANVSYIFANCSNLRSVDISTLDMQNWEVNTLTSVFSASNALYEVNGMSDIPVATNVTIDGSAFNARCLSVFDGVSIGKSFSFANCELLTPQSLRSIIAALPTVETATTLTLGAQNILKLTADEIAVANAKGWTVA